MYLKKLFSRPHSVNDFSFSTFFSLCGLLCRRRFLWRQKKIYGDIQRGGGQAIQPPSIKKREKGG